jgi:hypothetical protein
LDDYIIGGMIAQELALLMSEQDKIKMHSLTLSCTHPGGKHAGVPVSIYIHYTRMFFEESNNLFSVFGI